VTQVRLGIVLPTTDGTVRRPSGSLEFRPTKRRNVGTDVVLPAPVTKGLTDPPSIAELAPTGPDWAWQVVERVQGGSPRSRYLAVPDSASVVDYKDLVEVDPATLELTATTANPFWWTQVADYVTAGLAGKQNAATLGAAVAADATVRAAFDGRYAPVGATGVTVSVDPGGATVLTIG
jgi:hypothetical protein